MVAQLLETMQEFIMDTGSLYCGVRYDSIYEAVEAFALDHEEMRGFAIPRRFPQLSLPLREDLLYVDNGGVIDNNRSARALLELAKVTAL